jgi:hypothetical protein
MVIPFGLTNAPGTFESEINRVLGPLLGMELGINTEIHREEEEGMIVVAYIDDIIIMTEESMQQHKLQVGKVFDVLLENRMSVEIYQCVFKQLEASFLGFTVNGQSI